MYLTGYADVQGRKGSEIIYGGSKCWTNLRIKSRGLFLPEVRRSSPKQEKTLEGQRIGM